LLRRSLLASECARLSWWPDTLPKDILPNGHFAKRTFAKRTSFADGHFADGRFAERTFCRTDSLTNGQLAENRDIF
jgi:hypothetical protein